MQTHQLLTEFGPITYQLKISSRRRSMLIRIKDAFELHKETAAYEFNEESLLQALVQVVVPRNTKAEHIHAFLNEKSRWIINKSAEVKKRLAGFPQNTYIDGSELHFLGQKYPLKVIQEKILRSRVRFQDRQWIIRVPERFSAGQRHKEVKTRMFDWYKNEAKEILASRVFHFSRLMQTEPLKIAVRTQKRIWGSCHYRTKAIHLNWQIILAPLSVIDYVVVHELSHLKVPNHSKKFWRTVEEILPDYRTTRQWLKENQQHLLLEV